MALPDGVTIRRGVPAEAEALAQLHLDVWDDAYTGLMLQEILNERRAKVDERIERWRGILGQDEPTWPFENAKGLVGFVSIGPNRANDTDIRCSASHSPCERVNCSLTLTLDRLAGLAGVGAKVRLPEVHDKVAGLLRGPGPVRRPEHAQHTQVAVADLEHEQHVEPPQGQRAVDVESRPRACRWPACAGTAANWCRCVAMAPGGRNAVVNIAA